ncbi:MAG: hypothetical protein LBC75_10580 [Fibromonadaceae bacterium]|jgi:hypothetical protein|nr:hypothetical protein [Fibromonadaceae bacterium]
MDLREKMSLVQRISEYSIRFRLILILIAVLLCSIALVCIDGVLGSLVILAMQTLEVTHKLVLCDFNFLTHYYGVIFAVFALFLFRWKFFGFKCSLLWFFFLIFDCLLLIAVEECKNHMPILLACIFVFAVTNFFFIRGLVAKSMLPFILLAYVFSAWLLLLNVSNLAWFGFISLFFADAFHFLFILGYQIRRVEHKKTLKGAIVHSVRKTIPVSLLSIILLIILDIIYYFMKLPLLASVNLLNSIIIYICYVIWMPFFTAAILSFCPLENTCEKMQQKSK